MKPSLISTALRSLFALALAAPLFAQDGAENEIQALRRENWKLKKILLSLPEKDVGLGKHALDFGMTLVPASDQVAKPLGLRKGNGLFAEAVDGPSAKQAGIEAGDLITRVKGLDGAWEEACLKALEGAFLPGDTATLEVCRGMRRIQVPLLVLCSCGTGKACPFFTPLRPVPSSPREQPRKAILFAEAKNRILDMKPAGKKWTDMTREDLRALAAKVRIDGLGEEEILDLVHQIWREQCVAEQQLPSEDPVERWKKLAGSKFEKLRAVSLLDKDGTLNRPFVTVWKDAEKTEADGEMNHDQWVEVLETKGDMTRVRRRSDKKEAWIESRYLKEIYTKEDLRKGSGRPSEKEGEKKGLEEWD